MGQGDTGKRLSERCDIKPGLCKRYRRQLSKGDSEEQPRERTAAPDQGRVCFVAGSVAGQDGWSPESKAGSGRGKARDWISQATLIYPCAGFGLCPVRHGKLPEDFKRSNSTDVFV